MRLFGKLVIVRPPEAGDDNYILSCENDRSLWAFSNRKEALSSTDLVEFRKHRQDFFSDGQLRLIITLQDGTRVGIIDLFSYQKPLERAEIGILIFPEIFRRSGLALESINMVINYAFEVLHLKAIEARVQPSNSASQQLFLKAGFHSLSPLEGLPLMRFQKTPA